MALHVSRRARGSARETFVTQDGRDKLHYYCCAVTYRGEAGSLEDGESYDWFFGYSRLAVYLNLHVGGARAGRVLVLGCGNSEVSPKMWENGWK